MKITLDLRPGGPLYMNADPEWLREQGVAAAAIGAALKAMARAEVAETADDYRAKLASTSAGKLQAYRIKEGLAADPANEHARSLATTAGLDPVAAAAQELALVEREAAARGWDATTLTAVHAGMALAYRQIALLIEALEAEAGAAITAIPDDADDIEAQIAAVLEAAKAEAETEYQNALALMAGG